MRFPFTNPPLSVLGAFFAFLPPISRNWLFSACFLRVYSPFSAFGVFAAYFRFPVFCVFCVFACPLLPGQAPVVFAPPRPCSSLLVPSLSLHTVSRVCCGLFAFFALFWSFTLSIVPRTCAFRPRGPDFPDLDRSNPRRSFAVHLDSSRASLSPFDAVDDTSSFYRTSQSARFLPTCICFAGILGFHGSRAPPPENWGGCN